jgi:hypothetical protein
MSWKSLFESARLAADTSDAQQHWWRETRAMIERANPAIYWYPGSGNDLTPLVLDAPNNPTGQRLFPVAGPQQKRPIILWMNDYAPDHGSFPAGYRGPADCNHEVWQRLGAMVALAGQPTELTVPPPDGCLGKPIAMRFFRATLTNDDIGTRERPAEGDEYTVIYSPVESESLLRSVFVPHRLAVEVVALIRQGGFSYQRPFFGGEPLQQYTDLPRILAESADAVGRVTAYVVDRDDWQLDNYRQSAMRLDDWGAHGARLFVRDGTELATRLHRED